MAVICARQSFFPIPAVWAALLIGACFALLPQAEAQVLVYRVEFEKTDRSINFETFDRGYFVVDGLGGSGSFLVSYREDGRDFYLESADSGELFFAVRPGSEKAVIRAAAENGTARSHYLLIGDLSGKISVNLRGQRVTLAVSPFLRGTALASDSEADIEFLAADGSLGFAGFANLNARLDRGRTRSANQANQTVPQALADLVADWESSGIENGAGDQVEATITTETTPRN